MRKLMPSLYGAAISILLTAQAMAAVRARGRVPLLVGGTMLYFKALREGLSDLPDANPQVRARIDAEAAREGWPALHARLSAIDPPTGARLQDRKSTRLNSSHT